MNIKPIYIAAFSLLMGMLFSSCDDKLDIKPKNLLILEKTSEYAGLLDYRDLLYYPSDYPWYASFSSGANELSLSDANPMVKANFLGLTDVDRTTLPSGSDLYAYCYTRISRYNIIIDNVMGSVGAEKDRKRTLAEALILRAYNYFVLVNTYCKHYNAQTAEKDGGVFVREKFDIETIPAQYSVAQVYKLIESDIERALPDLATKGMNVNHPGLDFGYALKAKVHLFKQEFDKAKEAAQKSLSYNSYIFDMVKWDNSTKPVPAIEYSSAENLYFGYGRSPYFFDLPISPRLVALYGKGDLRQERMFWSTKTTLTPGSKYYRAYIDTVGKNTYVRQIKFNVGGMRVPEVVLMLAECLIREGSVNEGIALINDLRKKRVLPAAYVDLAPKSKEEAFKMLFDERERELVMTPNNFYDIRRLEVEGTHQSTERVLSDGRRFTVSSNSRIFVIPFSRDAISRNGVLKQNVEM